MGDCELWEEAEAFRWQTFWASQSSDLKGERILNVEVVTQDYGPGTSSISDPVWQDL